MQDYGMDMTESSGSGMGSFAIGLCCGAAIGAVIALMYAPKPGAEMRRSLSDQTEWIRRRAGDQAGRVKEQASQFYSGASETLNTVVERGREALNVGKEAFNKTRPHNGSATDMGV
jgi:gas vesicle protein